MIIGSLRQPGPARCLAILACAAMIVIGIAPVAAAHVRVSAVDAAPGGYGLLTFRVPTESDTASTTEVIISFPKKTPIASASVAPVPGWTATVHTTRPDKPVQTDNGQIDEYVTTVDWKADSARTAIKPGQFGLFNISAGPLPKSSKVTFPTDQRYSNGTVVSWDQIATGSAAPEHPAPTLQLASSGASSPGPTAAPPTANAGATNTMGVVALILGVVAVVIATIALLRTRRPSS